MENAQNVENEILTSYENKIININNSSREIEENSSIIKKCEFE